MKNDKSLKLLLLLPWNEVLGQLGYLWNLEYVIHEYTGYGEGQFQIVFLF